MDGGPGDPADATAVSADPSNSATATGGRGGAGGTGASGGAGGAASARTETNTTGPASSIATATGGAGGTANGTDQTAGDGGSAVTQAVANGAGGSEARAIATGGRGGDGSLGATGASGGDALLADAVSGSDPVSLLLEQRATGGDAGATLQVRANSLPGGRGGDASSTGDFENPDGGDIHVLLSAIGGEALSRLPSAGEAGGAHVGGRVTSFGAGDAVLEATARSGLGATGGALVIDPLLAHATGTGDASASLEAERRGDAPALSLVNAVDAIASPSAAITLRQTASFRFGSKQPAESTLDVSKSAALLDLEANANGGEASIVVRGRNDAGDVRLSGEARGDTSFESVDPADARAEFEAETSGDGQDIEIGSASRPARAVGSGGDDPIRGGDAEVIATGTALGNSAIQIEVLAEGGFGGEFHAGDAFASAEGRGGGTQPVSVTATAEGGSDGSESLSRGVGGDAVADAFAVGQGLVTAHAIARGGTNEELPPGGGAFARARATGASGSVEALASSGRLFDGDVADSATVGRIQLALAARLTGDAAISASTNFSQFGGEAELPLDAHVRAAYFPEAALLDEALAGNPRAAAAVPPPRPRLPIALVELRAYSGDGIEETFTADIVLGAHFGGFDDKPEAVRFSFLDPEIDDAGFGSLKLRSWDTRDAGEVYEITFASALDALAFLDDGRLPFSGLPRERHLEIIFETTGAEGAFFLDFMVAAVPEPKLGLLLSLVALAAIRPGRFGHSLRAARGGAHRRCAPAPGAARA